jgi:hypothetical protein
MKGDAMTSAHVLVALVLLCASLTGCDSIPQPPPGPQGSSAANWSNDFLRAESGVIWVVNATWTEENKVIFRDKQFTPEQFRQMLSAQEGITTNTPISILQEPGVTAPAIEWQRFEEAGYKYTRFLSLPKRYWRWWRKTHAQAITGASAN